MNFSNKTLSLIGGGVKNFFKKHNLSRQPPAFLRKIQKIDSSPKNG
jgi:predicted transcriptional regulator